MKDKIEIEEQHKNHIKVKLRQHLQQPTQQSLKSLTNSSLKQKYEKKKAENSHSLYYKDVIGNLNKQRTGYNTLKDNAFEQMCRQMDNQGYNKLADHKKSFSNLQDYLNNIKFFVMTTI